MVRACDGDPAEPPHSHRNPLPRFAGRRRLAGRRRGVWNDGGPEAIVIDDRDSRSSLSIGLDWGGRVTAIGLEFCTPAVLGYVIDRWLGTQPWATVVGAILGMVVGMMHVLRLPAELARANERAKGRGKPGGSTPRDAPG
jgi:ATP synthase protein I